MLWNELFGQPSIKPFKRRKKEKQKPVSLKSVLDEMVKKKKKLLISLTLDSEVHFFLIFCVMRWKVCI